MSGFMTAWWMPLKTEKKNALRDEEVIRVLEILEEATEVAKSHGR